MYMYRYDSRPRMMTLGRYPVLTLADARVDLAKAKALLAKGQDPGTLFLQVKADHQGTPTVSHLAAEFIQKRSQNKKAWQEEQRILQKDVLPKWKHRKAQDIKRRDVIVLLDRIVERGSPIMANRTLGVLNRMFNFGIRRAILEGNPCSIIERPGEESPRDRVLSSEEIKNFWINIDKCRMANGTKLALKFLLVCLQRKSEVAQAEWVDFDINSGWWNIPKKKTKNKLSHRVYLSPTAIELLKKIKELSGDSIYLFPSPRPDRNKPITPRSLSQALLKNLNTLKIEPFAPHDLRRSGSSHMTGNGIPRETVQKILNHVERGVTKVYDRYSYDQEKKNAMTKWGRILNRIITGETGKIIQMRQK